MHFAIRLILILSLLVQPLPMTRAFSCVNLADPSNSSVELIAEAADHAECPCCNASDAMPSACSSKGNAAMVRACCSDAPRSPLPRVPQRDSTTEQIPTVYAVNIVATWTLGSREPRVFAGAVQQAVHSLGSHRSIQSILCVWLT